MPELYFQADEWFPFGSGIYFLSHEGSKTGITLFDLQTKQVRPTFTLVKPTPPWLGGMAVSSDGKWLLYSQVDQASSDLMLGTKSRPASGNRIASPLGRVTAVP